MKYTVFGSTGLFGTGWGYGADADVSTAIFNAYVEAGGNFIDSADVYQFGQSAGPWQ
jgi:aryl-alcohol dehydrogenase-like predicted oxidoreductase